MWWRMSRKKSMRKAKSLNREFRTAMGEFDTSLVARW